MNLQSAQTASRGAKQKRNSADLAATRESVVRELLNRREFFVILASAAAADRLLAQHDHQDGTAGPDFAAYQPKALTKAEYQLLDEMAETLLPADETGPGAHDAHLVYYMDVVLSHGSDKRIQSWKTGLTHVEQLANSQFRQSFGACSAQQRQELLGALARNEFDPVTDADQFFIDFKRMAVDAFYASELIQREHLGYKGNTAIAEFPGCTHPNFQHPDLA